MSKKPLKCKIAFAIGKDSTGKTLMTVDANNNLDLSDDSSFVPLEFNDADLSSMPLKDAIMISYERFSGDRIIQDSTPLFVVHMKEPDLFLCCFPQYATANLGKTEIDVCSDNFTTLSYNKACVTLFNDSLKISKKIKRENLISQEGYLKIDGNIYKNKGVNLNKNVLVLEKINSPKKKLYSNQIGYKPFPFEGQIFKIDKRITLNDCKGKYVLLDFWAVWCGPCREELPNLKALYDNTDKSKFEIIGIVGNSKSDLLEKMIKDYSITWPQIMSDETNKIKEKYNVTGYPTTILINPKGTIIAIGLRGKQLENKINELIKKE